MSSKNKMIEEEQLRNIRHNLMIAASQASDASRTVKPFRRSKFLNMLYKEIKQLEIEMHVFLGDAKPSVVDSVEFLNLPSLNSLKALISDNELEETL